MQFTAAKMSDMHVHNYLCLPKYIRQSEKIQKRKVGNLIMRDDFSLGLLTASVRRRVCRVVKQMSLL